MRVCVCLSDCGHAHGRISSSIFTKLDTDVYTPKSKNEFVRGSISPHPLPYFPPKPSTQFWGTNRRFQAKLAKSNNVHITVNHLGCRRRHCSKNTLGAETPTTDARKEVVRHLTFCSTLLSYAFKCCKRLVVNTSNFTVTRSMCRLCNIKDHEASPRDIKRPR